MSEYFSFGITRPDFNDPLSDEYNPNLLPHDLSRSGRPFQYVGKDTGGLYSGFFQDNLRLGDFQLSLGLRYDSYRFLVNGQQWQPRLGASYHLKATNTVFRASYNRLFQTPPNENLLLSSSREAAAIAPPVIAEQLAPPSPQSAPNGLTFSSSDYNRGLGRA